MDTAPNILFIVADDLNSWIGALGRHPQVRTPNIDALARRGTLFSHAYCAAPYCNSSRMSAFTGCLPSTTGVYHFEPYWGAPNRRPTLFEGLKEAGYALFGAGKVFHGAFDFATPARSGGAAAPWLESQNDPALWDAYAANGDEPTPRNLPLHGMFDLRDPADPRYDDTTFDWGPVDDALESDFSDVKMLGFVEDVLARSCAAPFLLATGLYKPHLPWHAPRRYFDMYPLEDVVLPLVRADDLDDVPETARRWALRPPDHDLILRHGQWRRAVQAYLACISFCDAVIGRIVAALDRSAHADGTVVVLWGDNGFHLGEKLHWRKFVLWEEATRVPLILAPARSSAPWVPAVADPVSLIDLHPTLLDLAGAPCPPVDGRSLLPALRGESVATRPAISTWERGNHTVRLGRWRHTRYADGGEELYDHAADPHEWRNLADDSRYATIKADLAAHLPIDKPAA